MTISLVDLATSGFYSVRSNYARENIFKDVREMPLKELSRLKLRRLSRLNTFQKIARSLPTFLIIPVEIMYFMMLSNAFRKRICKHENKRKSYKSCNEIATIG